MDAGIEPNLLGLSCPPSFMGRLVLGSGSPRRKELLAVLGIPFTVRTAHTDEHAPQDLSDVETVLHVAREKAEALIPSRAPMEVILTADTEVWLDDQRLGKPGDLADALRMLQSLRGKTHRVITALWATDGKRWKSAHRSTEVQMGNLPDSWLDWYVDTYRPLDKAGAYGAQEWIGHVGIAHMVGDFDTVKGLPLPAVLEVLGPWLR